MSEPTKVSDKQAEADRKLNRRIDDMLVLARRNEGLWQDIYRVGFNYIYDAQLEDTHIKKGFPHIMDNEIFPSVMQELALLDQRRPAIKASPVSPEDAPGTNFWGQALQWQFTNALNMPMHLRRGALDGAIYGHWVGRVKWNPQATWLPEEHRWTGAINLKLCKAECFNMDPEGDPSELEKARYAYLWEQRTVAELVADFPDQKDEIEEAARKESGKAAEGFGGSSELPAPWTGSSGTGIVDDGATVRGEAGVDAAGLNVTEGAVSHLLIDKHRMPGYDILTDGDDARRVPNQVTVLEIWFKDNETIKRTNTRKVDIAELLLSGRAVKKPDIEGIAQHFLQPDPETADAKDQVEAMLGPQNWPTVDDSYDEPMYPNGRHVIRIGLGAITNSPGIEPGGGLKLLDEPWPYVHWPIAIGRRVILPHDWHGLNAVCMTRMMQDWRNDAWSHVGNNLKHFGDPVWKVEKGALQNSPENRNVAETIGGRSGLIVKLEKGRIGAAVREPAPPMGEVALTVLDHTDMALKNLTGIHDVAMGKAGASTATEAIRLETNTRLRTSMMSNLMDDYTIRVFDIIHEFLANKWSPADMVRITGEGSTAQVVQVMAEHLSAKFDIMLEVGTSLPFDRERKKQDAQTLFGLLGPAYLLQLLDAFEVKDKDAILAKLPVFQMVEQIMAQQQQAGQPGGGPQTETPGAGPQAATMPQAGEAGGMAAGMPNQGQPTMMGAQ